MLYYRLPRSRRKCDADAEVEAKLLQPAVDVGVTLYEAVFGH